MGIYIISGEELEENFNDFLSEQEGDVPADAVAEAWNIIAKREKWHDRLIACDKRTYEKLIEILNNKQGKAIRK